MERSLLQNMVESMSTAMWIAFSLGNLLYLIEDNGCFNRILFREQLSDRRIAVGLQPFMKNWEHEKLGEGHMWCNPVRGKQGLSCWYKSQNYNSNLLVSETDAWKYIESDSIHFSFYHQYYFVHNTPYNALLLKNRNHEFHVLELDRPTNNFLKRHGISVKDSIAFAKTILFLSKRADSLHLNNQQVIKTSH